MAEAAEVEESIPNARQDFTDPKAKMSTLHHPDRTISSSRRVMEKVVYDFYLDLVDNRAQLPQCHGEDGNAVPLVLPPEVRHAIKSVKKLTAPCCGRIRLEHLKNLPLVLINIVARLSTRYLSECKVPNQWKTSRTLLLHKQGDLPDIAPSAYFCRLQALHASCP